MHFLFLKAIPSLCPRLKGILRGGNIGTSCLNKENPLIVSQNRLPTFPCIFSIDVSVDEFDQRIHHDHEVESVRSFTFDKIKEFITSGQIFTFITVSTLARFLLSREISLVWALYWIFYDFLPLQQFFLDIPSFIGFLMEIPMALVHKTVRTMSLSFLFFLDSWSHGQ